MSPLNFSSFPSFSRLPSLSKHSPIHPYITSLSHPNSRAPLLTLLSIIDFFIFSIFLTFRPRPFGLTSTSYNHYITLLPLYLEHQSAPRCTIASRPKSRFSTFFTILHYFYVILSSLALLPGNTLLATCNNDYLYAWNCSKPFLKFLISKHTPIGQNSKKNRENMHLPLINMQKNSFLPL